jgi:dolichyl-diphosphooligosaccharide--protein glycosyltransferase
LTRVLTPVALFALALAVRVLPWPTVIESDRVVFFGMDAWYHLRRIQMVLTTTGWPAAFDPYDNFPAGGMPIWPPLFDAALAFALWPVHALGDWLAVERAAALVPPLLGALCVVALYRVALRLFDATVAAVAGLLLSLLSAHFWYSQLGFVDHHVAAALVATLLLGVAVSLLATLTGTAPAVGWRRGALAFGAGAALSLLLWPGLLLEVGLAELALGIGWMTRRERGAAIRGAVALTLANGLAFVLVLPSGWSAEWVVWTDFSPAVLSRFQPWMFASLTLLTGVCALLWRRGTWGRTRQARVAHVLVLGLALLAASPVAFPELPAGGAEAWRWLAKDEVFQAMVMESKPLFIGESGFDRSNAELRLSRFLYLLPLLLGALAWHARGSAKRPALTLLIGWTLAFAAATLLQRRFFNSLAPAFAAVVAWSVVSLFRAAAVRVGGGRPGRVAATAVLLAACVWLFAPTLGAYRLPLSNLVAAARGTPMTVPRNELSRRVLIETAEWLRDNTPPTDAPLDPASRPEYGVMAPWGFGHLLKYVARRPTVVGNFGDDVGEANMRRATAYFVSREPDAVRILDDLRVRYVLTHTLADADPALLRGDAMRRRMSLDDSPGWRHHRLLYESRLEGDRAEIGRSEYRLFERVAGAHLRGRAPPGATVLARLGYESHRGRRGTFESAVAADAAGRYELVLPYATRGAPPGVRSEAAYEIYCEGRRALVAIAETDVQSGAAIAGPDFESEAAGDPAS